MDAMAIMSLVRPKLKNRPKIVNMRDAFKAEEEKRNRLTIIKMAAVQQVGYQMMLALEMIEHSLECGAERFATVELPLKVFSWSIKDCLRRRQHTLAWHKLVLKQYTHACLRKRKIIVDFEELKKYSKLAIEWHKQQHMDFDLGDLFRSVRDYMNYDETLQQERDANWDTMIGCLRIRAALRTVEPLSQTRYRLRVDDMKPNYLLNTTIRYARDFCENSVNQAEAEDNAICGALSKQLEESTERMQNEIFCSTCCVNYYYSEIQALKDRIEELNSKYDEDYDKIVNKVSYAKLTLEKMGTQRIYLAEERIRFKEELSQHYAQMAKEAERERLAAIEQAMRLIVPEKKKKRKKKKAEPEVVKPKTPKVKKEEPASIKDMMKDVMKIKSTKVPKNLVVKNFTKKLNKKYQD